MTLLIIRSIQTINRNISIFCKNIVTYLKVARDNNLIEIYTQRKRS